MTKRPQRLFKKVLALHKNIKTPFEDLKTCCSDTWKVVTEEVESTLKLPEDSTRSGPKAKPKKKGKKGKGRDLAGTGIRKGTLVISRGLTRAAANFCKAVAGNIGVLLEMTKALDDIEALAAAHPASLPAKTRADVCFLRRFYGQLLPAHVRMAEALHEAMRPRGVREAERVPPVQRGFLDPACKDDSDCSEACTECQECEDFPTGAN